MTCNVRSLQRCKGVQSCKSCLKQERKENVDEENDDGECLYNEYGWNTNTLMTEVCEKYGWSWEYLNADIDVCI